MKTALMHTTFQLKSLLQERITTPSSLLWSLAPIPTTTQSHHPTTPASTTALQQDEQSWPTSTAPHHSISTSQEPVRSPCSGLPHTTNLSHCEGSDLLCVCVLKDWTFCVLCFLLHIMCYEVLIMHIQKSTVCL